MTAGEKRLSPLKGVLYPPRSVKSRLLMGVVLRVSSITGVLAAASLGVVACSREPGPPAAVDDTAAEYPVPVRQPGLWRQVSMVEGLDRPIAMQLCVDKATDAQMAWWGPAARRNCKSDNMVRKADGSWSFDSDCQDANGVRVVRSGVVVGDFDIRYQLKATTTISGLDNPGLRGTRTISIDAERLGSCPAGMRPGDVELPDGMRVKASDLIGTP